MVMDVDDVTPLRYMIQCFWHITIITGTTGHGCTDHLQAAGGKDWSMWNQPTVIHDTHP